jgi:hypothetical protein
MSDRSRSVQTGNSVVEGAGSLPGLSAANEPGHSAHALTQPANQSDLAAASISSKDVMRVSQRVEPRRDLHPSNQERNTSSARSKDSQGKSPLQEGILNNPTYRYGGDLVTRFITLLANILKFIERLFLRLLSGPDGSVVKQRPQNNAKENEQSHPAQHERERGKKERKDQERTHAQTIRRG